MPRGVLMFLIVTHVWALLWWFLVPAWPLGTTYTKGLLGTDQQQDRRAGPDRAQAQRAARMKAIETSSLRRHPGRRGPDAARPDDRTPALRRQLRRLPRRATARGRANYPDLTDDDWLWGGGPEMIEQTMRVGINTAHPDTRIGQMPAFGRDEMLDRNQVTQRRRLCHSLTIRAVSTAENIEQIEGRAGGLPDHLRGLPRRGRARATGKSALPT